MITFQRHLQRQVLLLRRPTPPSYQRHQSITESLSSFKSVHSHGNQAMVRTYLGCRRGTATKTSIGTGAGVGALPTSTSTIAPRPDIRQYLLRYQTQKKQYQNQILLGTRRLSNGASNGKGSRSGSTNSNGDGGFKTPRTSERQASVGTGSNNGLSGFAKSESSATKASATASKPASKSSTSTPTSSTKSSTSSLDTLTVPPRTKTRKLKAATHNVNVELLAKSVGVRLTPNELVLLRSKLDQDGDGIVTLEEIEGIGRKALRERMARDLCLQVICNGENQLDKYGVRVVDFFDYSGTALFAVVGTQVAGDLGMNIVGCCLVGCAAAMGGGTLNMIMYGGASPLLGKPGVRWVVHPSYLLVAMAASIFTFFAWPYYCQTQAQHYLENVVGKENLTSKKSSQTATEGGNHARNTAQITSASGADNNEDEWGTISKDAFLDAWKENADFRQTIRDALPDVAKHRQLLLEIGSLTGGISMISHRHDYDTSQDPYKYDLTSIEEEAMSYFHHIDMDKSGDIDRHELEKLVQRRFHNGWETYWLDSFALSALSIAAVTSAIRVGVHPIVAATSGVTVCFGGILRDLLCGRDLAIGSQSYAFATGASSTVYIALRELAIRRIFILPLIVRTFVSAGTCVGLRGWEFIRGQPLLRPMHGRTQPKVKSSHHDKDE